MSTKIGITVSGIQEKCTIGSGCPRHIVHGRNEKDARKMLSKPLSDASRSIGFLKENSDLNSNSVGLAEYADATHECNFPSTALRSKYTCKQCGKTYLSQLSGGEGAYFFWEEYTPEMQKTAAETCRCKPPTMMFKNYGTTWSCPKCGSQFKIEQAGGEIGGKVWRQI